MSAATFTHDSVAGTDTTDGPDDLLDLARQRYLEDPRGALADMVRAHEAARLLGDDLR